MRNHLQRAAARTTTLARQPGSISGETKPRAVDQPIATPELPSAVPLMALSTGFWAFKTLAAAHELDLFSRLAGGAGITVAGLAEAFGLHPIQITDPDGADLAFPKELRKSAGGLFDRNDRIRPVQVINVDIVGL